MTSSLIFEVDALAGTAVQQVAKDLITMADNLGCGVECNVNGVRLLAFPGTKLASLEQEYKREIERPS